MVFHLHIPKTGGTSVGHAIAKNGLGKRTKYHRPIWAYPFKDRKNNYIFATKRNPYDRAVSTYYFVLSGGKTSLRYWFSTQKTINEFFNQIIEHPRSFRILCDHYIWFKTQYHYLTPKKQDNISPHINKVIAFENLNEDWRALKNEVKSIYPAWENAPENLPHKRKTKARNKRPWTEVLDETGIKAINQLYAKDFDLLGYEKI